MKKLTAEEKLDAIARWIAPDPPHAHPMSREDIVRSIVDCPYGDTFHYQQFGPTRTGERRDVCPTCSSLDGSECADDLIETYDQLVLDRCVGLADDHPLAMAIERVREWRASKVKP